MKKPERKKMNNENVSLLKQVVNDGPWVTRETSYPEIVEDHDHHDEHDIDVISELRSNLKTLDRLTAKLGYLNTEIRKYM